jgi:quercetin dioxygenase-like cupin family protein
MHNRLQSCCIYFAAMLAATTASSVLAQAAADPPGRNIADMKFAEVPGMPTCARASVQSGDPSKGASILLAKMAAGCVFPWHWHTPNENLMMINGSGLVEMKGGKAFTLKPGGFAQMPSKHAHQVSCPKGCTLYVNSDAAFDMHYVDTDGKDISPAEALKKVHETPAAAPK